MKTIKLIKTGTKDFWGNPIYRDIQTTEIYKDIDWNEQKPYIHTTTNSGEPDYPVKNFEIVK